MGKESPFQHGERVECHVAMLKEMCLEWKKSNGAPHMFHDQLTPRLMHPAFEE